MSRLHHLRRRITGRRKKMEQPVTEDSKQTVTEETEQSFDTSLQEKGVSSVGEFTTQDVNGNEYTQDMF